MNGPAEQGIAGQQRVLLPAPVIETARRHSLLRGLLATGAGFFPKAAGHSRHRSGGADHAVLIYCVKGRGWCEVAGRIHPVPAGNVLVLPPGIPHACGADHALPWTIHWVHAAGILVPDYLAELGAGPGNPLLWVGEDLQLVLLFNEVLRSLEKGFTAPHLLQASHALGHLVAVMIRHRCERSPEAGEGFQKIGTCIEYMSEHLDEPLKVGALAALASLSPAHFAALFKEQTGSSPRGYLHLLRMHRACQWLTGSPMTLKEIAGRLGYQDQFHFSRKFKSFSGISPSGYRARHQTMKVGES